MVYIEGEMEGRVRGKEGKRKGVGKWRDWKGRMKWKGNEWEYEVRYIKCINWQYNRK